MNLREMIVRGTQRLKECDRPSPEVDSRWLAMHQLGYDTASLLLHYQDEVPSQALKIYESNIERRSKGEPLQYITNEQSFMGYSFYVDKRVLIPRLDTEILVDTLLTESKKGSFKKGIEVGIGSGCISISLLKALEDLIMIGLDLSQEALEVAALNRERLEVTHRLILKHSDLFSGLEIKDEKVDLIVSNPPYISKKECEELMTEVIDYEPRIALTDEADGLMFYKRITKEGKPYLKSGGILAYEIGCFQGKDVYDILVQEGFKDVRIVQDLTHKDRVVLGIKP